MMSELENMHSASVRMSVAKVVTALPVAVAMAGGLAAIAGEQTPRAKPKGPSSNWAVPADASLRESLEGWSEAAGWTVVWDSKTDYRIRVSATFSGTFESAVSELINAVHVTNPEIAVTLYRGNNVLHAVSMAGSR